MSISKLLPLCFFSCLQLGTLGHTGEFLFKEFSTVDGLSHSTVFDSFQDQDGFLWFGTYETVHRFDGYVFNEPLKKLGISTNRIRNITQDHLGRMWIATHEGAICISNNKVEKFGTAQGLIHDSVTQVLTAPNHVVWFATEAGITRMFPDGRMTHFESKDGLPNKHVRRLILGQDENVWIGTLGGLALFDGQFLQPITLDEEMDTPAIYTMAFDQQQRLWIGTTNGIFCLQEDRLDHFTLDDGLPSESIWDLAITSHGILWAGTDAGLCYVAAEKLVKGTATFRRASDTHYIGHTTIYSIDQDREGNLWFGTCIGLFQLVTPALQAFDFSRLNSGQMVLSLLASSAQELWIGTDRGVLLKNSTGLQDVTRSLDLPNTFVRSISVDPNNNGIWFGTLYGLALRRTPNPVTLTSDSGLPGNAIFSMYHHTDGWLYVGMQDSGLAAWRQGSIRTWGVDQGLKGRRIHKISPHPQGGLFIGTDRGLNRLYQHSISEVGLPVPSCEVYDLVTDAQGKTWVGTHLGLVLLDGNQSKLYQTKDGLPDNHCRQLMLDSHQRLWIGTSRGLASFNNQHFSSYHPPKPVAPFEMNHGAVTSNSQGEIWFGHYRGALKLNPDYVSEHRLPQPIFLKQVQQGAHVLPLKSAIKLSHSQNQLTFSYQGLYFRDPQNLFYRYRLLGKQDQWQQTSSTAAQFNSLKPGDYQFQVRSGNPQGNWSHQPASFSFSIAPPFWEQTWFRALAILLLALIISWQFFKLRTRNQSLSKKAAFLSGEVAREKAAKLEREAEVKLLHSQMNPHFLQNAFTNAIYLVKTEPKKAETMLLQLSQLFRRTMLAKRQVWTTIGDEYALIEDYLAIQKVRFGNKLRINMQVPQAHFHQSIPAFVIQPLVENACIHGQNETLGTLYINISCQELTYGYRITVGNNGQPFETPSGPPITPGHALDNINKRLSLLNQKPLFYAYVDGNHQFSFEVEHPHENSSH